MQLFTGFMTGGDQPCLAAGAKALFGETVPPDNQSAFMALLLAPSEAEATGSPDSIRNLVMGREEAQGEGTGVKHLPADAMTETGRTQNPKEQGKGKTKAGIAQEIPTGLLCALSDAIKLIKTDEHDAVTNDERLASPSLHIMPQALIGGELQVQEPANDIATGEDNFPLEDEDRPPVEQDLALNTLPWAVGGPTETGLSENEAKPKGALTSQMGHERKAETPAVAPLPKEPDRGSMEVVGLKSHVRMVAEESNQEATSVLKGLEVKGQKVILGEKGLTLHSVAWAGGGGPTETGLSENEAKPKGALTSQRGHERKAETPAVAPLPKDPDKSPMDGFWAESDARPKTEETHQTVTSLAQALRAKDPVPIKDSTAPTNTFLYGEASYGEEKGEPEIRVSPFSAFVPEGGNQANDAVLEGASPSVGLRHESLQVTPLPEESVLALETLRQARPIKLCSEVGDSVEVVSAARGSIGMSFEGGEAEDAQIIYGALERSPGPVSRVKSGEAALDLGTVEAVRMQRVSGGKEGSHAASESQDAPLSGHPKEGLDSKMNIRPENQLQSDASDLKEMKGDAPQAIDRYAAKGPEQDMIFEAREPYPLSESEAPKSRDSAVLEKSDGMAEPAGASSMDAASRKAHPSAGAVRNEAPNGSERPEPVFKAVASALYNGRVSKGEITLQLKPESLGRIRIRITGVEDRSVSVRIIAENPISKDMIEKGLAELRSELRINGVEMERCDVLLSEDQARDPGARAFRDHVPQDKEEGHGPKVEGPSKDLHEEEHLNATGLSVFV
jgi:hypothetical protein